MRILRFIKFKSSFQRPMCNPQGQIPSKKSLSAQLAPELSDELSGQRCLLWISVSISIPRTRTRQKLILNEGNVGRPARTWVQKFALFFFLVFFSFRYFFEIHNITVDFHVYFHVSQTSHTEETAPFLPQVSDKIHPN